MIATIEVNPIEAYGLQMRSLALRLLAFVAVLLMPFGMTAAPAASIHHEQMSAMPMQHCPDGPRSVSTGAMADCSMACAAALPAADLTVVGSHPVSRSPADPSIVARLVGIELEIATPPPRSA